VSKKRVLIVEDDPDIAEAIEYNLQQERFTPRVVADGARAIPEVNAFSPDLIVLDVMLPNMDGFEICKQLKSDPPTAHIPILMLTVRSSEVDVVLGLELGADDYVTKPFSPRVLVARIRNLLRREKAPLSPESAVISYSGLTINREKREVAVDGRKAPFSKTEFEIVALLASKPGKVFSRDSILSKCWPEGVFVVDRSVDVHINSIRKKLGKRGKLVETVRGVGYRMGEQKG